MANLFTVPRKGSTIVSAETVTLPADGDCFDVSGTASIAAMETGGRQDGARVLLHFAAALTLVHSASLALRAGANYTTEPGDMLWFEVAAPNAVRQIHLANSGGTDGGTSPLEVQEEDGPAIAAVDRLIFQGASVTDNEDGSVTVAGLQGPSGEAGPQGEAGQDGADGVFSAIATQAEAEAGTDNTNGMTPLRTAQAIAALGGGGGGGGNAGGRVQIAIIKDVSIFRNFGLRAQGGTDISVLAWPYAIGQWKTALQNLPEYSRAYAAGLTHHGETTDSGILILGLESESGNPPLVEVVEGEVRSIVSVGPVVYNDVTITPGDSLNTIENTLRVYGSADEAYVEVEGTSTEIALPKVLVTGAGGSAAAIANQLFVEDGTENGKPKYTWGDWKLYYDTIMYGGTWAIRDFGASDLARYRYPGGTSADVPPSAGYESINSASGPISVAIMSHYLVTGATGDYAVFNGRYAPVAPGSWNHAWENQDRYALVDDGGDWYFVDDISSSTPRFEMTGGSSGSVPPLTGWEGVNDGTGTPAFEELEPVDSAELDIILRYPAELGEIDDAISSGGTVTTLVEGGTATDSTEFDVIQL